MALKKLAGPFEYQDLYGDYREANLHLWVDELDGLLAGGSWWPLVANRNSFDVQYGLGIVQLDGTFTPRRAEDYGSSGFLRYDLGRRKLAAFDYHSAPNWYAFTRGFDWNTLLPPENPEIVTFNVPAVHDGYVLDPYANMMLPDRVLFLGYKYDAFAYIEPVETAIFSAVYGSALPPVIEHIIHTSQTPGGPDEAWRPVNLTACQFIPSTNPERTVFLVRNYGGESKALEYDHVAKQVTGWVRRLGAQPDLASATGGITTPPELIAFSSKLGVWFVQDFGGDATNGYRKRFSVFADEAEPSSLSNPVALDPVRAGDAVRFRVRLIGADGDPCIGQRVAWSVTGVGQVVYPTTTTDDDGYAQTTVAFAPTAADGPLAGVTVSAEVIF